MQLSTLIASRRAAIMGGLLALAAQGGLGGCNNPPPVNDSSDSGTTTADLAQPPHHDGGAGDQGAPGDGGISSGFQMIYDTILNNPKNGAQIACTAGIPGVGCHGRAPFGAGLNLSTVSDAYANLVGVKANKAPTKVRVIPGNPMKSFLLAKLENRLDPSGKEGRPMPYVAEADKWKPLSQDEIDAITQWIIDGAK